MANATPILKNGSRGRGLENYRLVSLTSGLGKLVESIIKEKNTNHIGE